jgi:peptidoglycan/xylan/chitin deacetylase (PgdA/CDA1 family)
MGRFFLALGGTPRPRGGLVTVINYHRISRRAFRKHLVYLRNNYQVLSPEGFLDWLGGRINVETPSILLTLDDGYVRFYQDIYPELKETETAALLFVPTGFVDGGQHFWEDELRIALQKSKKLCVELNGRRFSLHRRLYRADFEEEILCHLRTLDRADRDRAKEDLFSKLDAMVTEEDLTGYQFLGWAEIQEMAESGVVSIGSHTVNHPNLSLVQPDVLRFELLESKRKLEEMTGQPVTTLAYPYGDPGSFNELVMQEARAAGYVCAFTTVQGSVGGPDVERFRLKRIMLFDYQESGAVAMKLSAGLTGQRWFGSLARELANRGN